MIVGVLLVKSVDLVGLARLGHVGRRARAAADDGRRARRPRGARSCPPRASGFWPLVSMGAILGGTMRSPLTGVVFALELTHDVNMLLPLLLAVTVAHGFTVLTLRRSILTEKVAAAAIHLSREYAIDPLEILFVREVMRPTPEAAVTPHAAPLHSACFAYADEPLRMVVYRMAETGLTEAAGRRTRRRCDCRDDRAGGSAHGAHAHSRGRAPPRTHLRQLAAARELKKSGIVSGASTRQGDDGP